MEDEDQVNIEGNVAEVEKGEAVKSSGAPETVEKWFQDEFHGTVFSQNAELYNMVRSAVDRLKALLV